MPVVFVTYSLAYLGRSNFGFGAAAGLAASLHITESRAAFLSSAFFLGYFLFQIPAAAYAVRRSATRLVFFALISWGIFSGLTGVIRTYWLLVADRLLLGVAESLIFPSMLILLTHWFTRVRALARQRGSDSRQSRHGHVDGRGHRVSHQGRWLADDVCH